MSIHTLHIGSNYKGTSSELAGCVNDANDLYALCNPAVASATKLIGARADREGIIRAVRKVLHRLEPGDLAFISFSGHGTQEPDDNGDEISGYDQALVCDDFELFYDDEVAPFFDDREKDTGVVALIDACHSKTWHRGDGPSVRAVSFDICRQHERTMPVSQRKPRALWKAGSISGCEDGGYSYDGWFDGRSNGALTYYTAKAWHELEAPATYADLFQKVGGKRPRGYLPTPEYPQQPTKMGSAANFKRRMPFK